MIVLFDGTAAKPLGRMLFAEESSVAAPPHSPLRIWGARTQTIRAVACQQAGWFTEDDIARIIGGHTLTRLAARGEVIKARKSPMQRQQYRWGGRG